jgi:hypothetical protein
VLERYLHKAATKLQAVLARGTMARRRVSLIRRWRKLGLSHADMCREQIRYNRSLYVSKGHCHRFRAVAAVIQVNYFC